MHYFVEQVQVCNRSLRDERLVYTGVYAEFPTRKNAQYFADDQARATGEVVPVEEWEPEWEF